MGSIRHQLQLHHKSPLLWALRMQTQTQTHTQTLPVGLSPLLHSRLWRRRHCPSQICHGGRARVLQLALLRGSRLQPSDMQGPRPCLRLRLLVLRSQARLQEPTRWDCIGRRSTHLSKRTLQALRPVVRGGRHSRWSCLRCTRPLRELPSQCQAVNFPECHHRSCLLHPPVRAAPQQLLQLRRSLRLRGASCRCRRRLAVRHDTQ